MRRPLLAALAALTLILWAISFAAGAFVGASRDWFETPSPTPTPRPYDCLRGFGTLRVVDRQNGQMWLWGFRQTVCARDWRFSPIVLPYGFEPATEPSREVD